MLGASYPSKFFWCKGISKENYSSILRNPPSRTSPSSMPMVNPWCLARGEKHHGVTTTVDDLRAHACALPVTCPIPAVTLIDHRPSSTRQVLLPWLQLDTVCWLVYAPKHISSFTLLLFHAFCFLSVQSPETVSHWYAVTWESAEQLSINCLIGSNTKGRHVTVIQNM